MCITVLSQLEATIHREGFSHPLFSSSEDEVQEEMDSLYDDTVMVDTDKYRLGW